MLCLSHWKERKHSTLNKAGIPNHFCSQSGCFAAQSPFRVAFGPKANIALSSFKTPMRPKPLYPQTPLIGWVEDSGRNVCSYCVGGLTCKCHLNQPPPLTLGSNPKPVAIAITGHDVQSWISPACNNQSHLGPEMSGFWEGRVTVIRAKDTGHFILFFNKWH